MSGMTTQMMKQINSKEIPQSMFDAIALDLEECRVAFIAGFGGANVIAKYKNLCEFCFQFGLPIDAFL